MRLLQTELNVRDSLLRTSLSKPRVGSDGGILLLFWGAAQQTGWGECPRTAVTKGHSLEGLNNRNCSSHSSGGQMSQVKVATGFVSSEAPLLGMQAALLLLYLHITFPVCVSVAKIPLSIRTPFRLT